MAKLKVFRWKARDILGRSVWKTAHGYTAQIGGKQVRRFDAAWSKEDALDALAKFTRDGEPKALPAMTFADAGAKYLLVKARKRSLKEDIRMVKHLESVFGAGTPLADLSAARIAEYKAERLARNLSAATVNRPLALLRCLLTLAKEEWEVLASVPRIRLEKEPQWRIRWLEPDEETRLLDACRQSRNAYLAPAVVVSLETGLRRGELLGLTWERVDFSRGVLRLEVTKSGKRREVPMRQAVYDARIALPGLHEGRVWPAGSLRTAWETALTRAKIEDFHWHDTRHHFASWFVMRGGSIQALKEILGHATLAMTMRYAHLAPGHLRAEMMKTEQTSLVADRSADDARISPSLDVSACRAVSSVGRAPDF